MQPLRPQLTTELAEHVGSREVWRAPGYPIGTYRELVEQTAKLAYANRNQLLFFRGQDQDYQGRAGGSTLYPAIYRVENLHEQELDYRFRELDAASRSLVELFREEGIDGATDIARKRYIQWSILQHYNVVPTPLLDVTHSLRVACSFAQLLSTDATCYVYVLGLPYTTNRISINSEEDVVNIRLLSICPPAAIRPYFQEGYMAGTPDVTTNFDRKSELDFRHRLIAKFAIPRAKKFWTTGFEAMPEAALYPPDDRVEQLCRAIPRGMWSHLTPALRPPEHGGDLIIEWGRAEERLLDEVRRITSQNLPVGRAIDELVKRGKLSKETASVLHRVRKVRNTVAHTPSRVEPPDILNALKQLQNVLSKLPLGAA